MKPRTTEHQPQKNMFRPELIDIVDPQHELVLLADRVDWEACETYFGRLYKPGLGRPPIPTRMMVGLHLVKHIEKLSDEGCVKRWLDSPYVQYFCGEQYFQHEVPMDPTSMTPFRKRIGEGGAEQLLKLSIDAGLKTSTIKPESMKTVVIDTTVMEKPLPIPVIPSCCRKPGKCWLTWPTRRTSSCARPTKRNSGISVTKPAAMPMPGR